MKSQSYFQPWSAYSSACPFCFNASSQHDVAILLEALVGALSECLLGRRRSPQGSCARKPQTMALYAMLE